ncbi:MAG: mechanosensitive ion channel protein MscS [Candidatus Methanoperedenaceae archaeon]|nr:MAG: mechanosensitive ion channel protein MscS [Candidatus Methanoperedenaceae archaeon]
MEIPAVLLPLLILGVSLIIAAAISVIIKILQKKAEKTNTKIDDIILHTIGRPLYILVIVGGIYYAIHQTPFLADLINRYDQGYEYRRFIVTIFLTWIIASLVKRIIKEYGYEIAAKTEEEMDDRLVALADMSVTYIIWAFGLMLALAGVGIEIAPLVTGMGILGLAVALAAQNLLSNVFGGVTITLDQLYKIGDRVEMGGVYGDVYEIKPRYTMIKTLNNTIVTIPNSKVINEQIINYAVPDDTVRVKIPVNVAYGTDPKRVEKILLEISDKISLILKEPQATVRFTEYASSSQNLELIVWVRHYDERHTVIDRILREMFFKFKSEGIEMPFNQMDVHIKKD